MTGQHAVKGSHSHAHERPSGLGRLAALFKGHDPVPGGPATDLQDHGDQMNVTETLEALPPWPPAAPPDPAPLWTPANWHDTMPDQRAAMDRPYSYPWSITDDLDGLPLFRDTVHAHMVRQEGARGHSRPDGTWQARYARIWHERTAATVAAVPDFGLQGHDGLVDEIVSLAAAAVEAEDAARAAAAAAVPAGEYEGRHSAGEAAA